MISKVPIADFMVSSSPRKTTAKIIEIARLALSIGATWETFPA